MWPFQRDRRLTVVEGRHTRRSCPLGSLAWPALRYASALWPPSSRSRCIRPQSLPWVGLSLSIREPRDFLPLLSLFRDSWCITKSRARFIVCRFVVHLRQILSTRQRRFWLQFCTALTNLIRFAVSISRWWGQPSYWPTVHPYFLYPTVHLCYCH